MNDEKNYQSWFENAKKTAQELGRSLTAVLDLDNTLIITEVARQQGDTWNSLLHKGWYRRFHEPERSKKRDIAGFKMYVDSVALYDLAAFQRRGHFIKVVTGARYSYQEIASVFLDYGIHLAQTDYHNQFDIKNELGSDNKALYINRKPCFNLDCMLFDDYETNKPNEDRCLFHHILPTAFFPELFPFEGWSHAKNGNWCQALVCLDLILNGSYQIIAARLLHIAIAQNDRSAVATLIEKHPDLTITENGRTPMELAIDLGHWHFVNQMATRILPDEIGLAKYFTVFFYAAYHNKTETLHLLIRTNSLSPYLTKADGEDAGYGAIHFLVKHGNEAILQKLSDKHGVAIFEEKYTGRVSWLTVAIKHNRPEMIPFLIRLGMRLTTEQAIELANKKGWVELTAYLDGNAISESSRLAGALLHVAIAQKNQNEFERLMDRNPDLMALKDNTSPMQRAIDLGCWDFVNIMAKRISTDEKGVEECGFAFLRALQENITDTMHLLVQVNPTVNGYFPSGDVSHARVLLFIEKCLLGLSPRLATEKFFRIYDRLTDEQKKPLVDNIPLLAKLDWSNVLGTEAGFLAVQNGVLARCFYKESVPKFPGQSFSQLCQRAREEVLEKEEGCCAGFFSSTPVLNQFKKFDVDEVMLSSGSNKKNLSEVLRHLLRFLAKERTFTPSYVGLSLGP